jgi:ABC-2 type transport system permease protein
MTATIALLIREFRRFYRDRSRIIGTLITPLVLFAFIAGGFSGVAPIAAGERLSSYLLPGTLALSVMMTAIFSTISIIDDRKAGFLQSVLVAPVSAPALIASKVLAGALLSAIQATLVLVPLALMDLTFDLLLLPRTLLTLTMTGAALTALGFALAWFNETTQGYHGMMNGLLMPMWALSGSLFPAEGAAPVLKAIIVFNPLTPFVSLIRSALRTGAIPLEQWLRPLPWMVVFLLLAFFATRRTARAVST